MAGKAFSYDGDFYTLTGRIFDYLVLTILWILFSLPIVTFAASTAAFYYTAVKVMRRERGYMWEEFWRSFKANLKQGFWFSLLFFVLGWVIQFNIGYSLEINLGGFGNFLSAFYLVLGVLVLAIATYTIACLSRFNMSFGFLLKLGIYMTFRYFLSTICIVALIVVTYLLIAFVPLLIFVLPTGMMIGISYFMERVLQKHTPAPENDDLAPFQWYREQ